MDKITCYCCDKLATGQGDHVPPKNLFPKGLFSSVKPIIVPSCQEHNQDKSASDEYLKFILTSAARSAPVDVQGSTVRALVRHIKNHARNIESYGIEQKEKKVFLAGSAPIDFERLSQALEKIARGVYYHHTRGNKKLLGCLSVVPIFLGVGPHATAEEREQLIRIEKFTKQCMKEVEMFGAFKGLFSYQVIENHKMIAINMAFYEDKIVSVIRIKG